MTVIGYTMMCEQAGPKELVRDVQLAEDAGFEFAVISDHYFPWMDAMGHSPYAWSVLGAAAQITSRIELMTYVTCPIKRYHPAVIAQKAATVGILSDGRFTLGPGAGENLNEHITGGGWPPVNVRHQMLDEAVEIIRRLWTGEYVSYDGRHFQVDSAKLWDLPEQPLKLGIAASGEQSCRARQLAPALPQAGRALLLRRPRLRAHRLVGPRRAPEPRLSRAARPVVGDALLAPGGHVGAGPAGRPLRRRIRRPVSLAGRLPGVAGDGALHPRPGRPATAGVHATEGEAQARGLLRRRA